MAPLPPKPKAPPKKAPSTWNTALQAVFVGLTVWACHWVAHLIFHYAIVHRSNDPADPLVLEETPGYLAPEELSALKAGLKDHEMMLTELESLSSQVAFRATRGFIVRFNNDGVDRFRGDARYGPLVPLFERLRSPEANAFVMNVLVVGGSVGDVDAAALSRKDHAVGCHIDQDIAINTTLWIRTFTAHEVNVLYASVPEGMVGGDLLLYPFHHGIPATSDVPTQRVSPRENTLVRFRGDSYHCVSAHASPPRACDGGNCSVFDSARVSVVLEQYRIRPEFYHRTRVWEEEDAGEGY